MFNSQERTLRELAALTLTAGWKIIQVTRSEGSLFGHIIAVPVDIPADAPILDDADADPESSLHSTSLTRPCHLYELTWNPQTLPRWSQSVHRLARAGRS